MLEQYQPQASWCAFSQMLDPVALKYISQPRVGLSALRAHKYAHNFCDTPSYTCSCGLESETTTHFFLKCPYFTNQRSILISKLSSILQDTHDLTRADDHTVVKYLLYRDESLSDEKNASIIKETIKFRVDSRRFPSA